MDKISFFTVREINFIIEKTLLKQYTIQLAYSKIKYALLSLYVIYFLKINGNYILICFAIKLSPQIIEKIHKLVSRLISPLSPLDLYLPYLPLDLYLPYLPLDLYLPYLP